MRVHLKYGEDTSTHDLRDDGDLFGLFTSPYMDEMSCMFGDASAPWEALVRGETIDDVNEDDDALTDEYPDGVPWSIVPLPTPKLDQLIASLPLADQRELVRAAMRAGFVFGSRKNWSTSGQESLQNMLEEIAGHLWPVLPNSHELGVEPESDDDTRPWLDLFGYYVEQKRPEYKVTAKIETPNGAMDIVFTTDTPQGMRTFMRHPSLGYGMEAETADLLWQGLTHGQRVHYCNTTMTAEPA